MDKDKISNVMHKASAVFFRKGYSSVVGNTAAIYGFKNHALELSAGEINNAWKKASKSTRMELSKQDAKTV